MADVAEFHCPNCTIINNINNDECYICGSRFERREGQIPVNDERQQVVHIKCSSTADKSILETIWGYFILIFYTTYTVIITWTSETIIKIIAYLALILALHITYHISPYVIRTIIWLIKFIKKQVTCVIKRITEERTNPLVWIILTIVTAWCVANTFGINTNELNINSIKNRVSTIEIDVSTLKIDVNYLKSAVNKLNSRVDNLQTRLTDLEFTVERGFETLGDTVKTIDNTMTWVTHKMNETYTPYIENGGWVTSADTFVRETMYAIFSKLSSKPLTRREFGLGCFIKGTKIQIDRFGNSVYVEQLRNGHYVFSPVLNTEIQIKTFLHGNETGYMYQVVTNDSLNVTVTETHPMKICNVVDNVFDCNNNIAAQHIYEGNWTKTINGYQQIVSIQKVAVRNAVVYNFMLDVADGVLIASRAVIANGIYSLDLFAQQQHH